MIKKFYQSSLLSKLILILCCTALFLAIVISIISLVIILSKRAEILPMFLIISIFSSIFFIILSFIICKIFLSIIKSRLNKIELKVKKMINGDLNEQISFYKHDELKDFIITINSITTTLKESQDLKNEFISSISHELRTPLTAIKGWSETISSMSFDKSELYNIRQGLAIIVKETNRLSLIVEELLDFSSLQSGRLKLKKEKIDILAELEEAVYLYKKAAFSQNKQIIYIDEDNIALVFGDKDKLKQVFINCIDNALKYTKDDATIEISSVLSKKDITIYIKDDGIGIAKEDLAHVKEKFYKVNSSIKGSGIGLSLSSQIIEMHDGIFTIQSEENKGTLVTIKLNLIEEIAE